MYICLVYSFFWLMLILLYNVQQSTRHWQSLVRESSQGHFFDPHVHALPLLTQIFSNGFAQRLEQFESPNYSPKRFNFEHSIGHFGVIHTMLCPHLYCQEYMSPILGLRTKTSEEYNIKTIDWVYRKCRDFQQNRVSIFKYHNSIVETKISFET